MIKFLIICLFSAMASFGNIDSLVTINPQIKIETVFNIPKITGKGHIDSKLSELFELAVVGSDVHASIYKSNNSSMANSIVSSIDRGVNWNIIMDGIQRRKDYYYKSFTSKIEKKVPIHFCESNPLEDDVSWAGGSCLGSAINHNKFYLFSEITDPNNSKQKIKYVVAQTSSNLSGSQTGKYNDLIIFYGDKNLYESYLKYWSDMKEFDKDGINDYADNFKSEEVSDMEWIQGYFFPSSQNFIDPIITDLKAIDCSKDGEIHSAHSWLKGRRGEAVLNELDRLQTEGCSIHIIARTFSKNNKYVSRLKKSQYEVIFTNKIHSKVFMIRGFFKKDNTEQKSIVYAGAANLKDHSYYRNDEVALRIENDAIYDSYRAYWEKIREIKK